MAVGFCHLELTGCHDRNSGHGLCTAAASYKWTANCATMVAGLEQYLNLAAWPYAWHGQCDLFRYQYFYSRLFEEQRRSRMDQRSAFSIEPGAIAGIDHIACCSRAAGAEDLALFRVRADHHLRDG